MKKTIIGVDNGYGLTKTVHSSFITSLEKFDSEPPIKRKVIKYNDTWYAAGEKRLTVMNDKTDNENNYILTLIAIAEELKYRGVTEAHVYLSAGLPLTKFGTQKDDFKKYLTKNRSVKFNYEDIDYNIIIDENVVLSPQGYSAILPIIKEFEHDIVIVDIGSWTIDILPIIEGIPDTSGCITLNEGVIKCMNRVNEELRRVFGNDITEKQIQDVMQDKESNLPEKYLNVVRNTIIEYTKNIVSLLGENGFNLDTTDFVVIGGGACVISNFGMNMIENATVIGDINANAVGYEYIAKAQLGIMD